MKLSPIFATGVKAYCSDIVTDPHEPETAYFLSVCGYQATVKGIIANFLENHGISIQVDGVDYYLVRSSLKHKVLVKKMPSGLVHGVVFPKLAMPVNGEENQNSFYIFSETTQKEALLRLFYRHLDEKIDLPLHPSWKSWLWQVFKEQDDWLSELKTLIGTCRGYSFYFNPTKLHDLISDAIRNKTPAIIECMQYKGGNSE